MKANLSRRNTLALLPHHRIIRLLGVLIGFVILLWLVALAQAAQVTLAMEVLKAVFPTKSVTLH